MVKGKLVRHGNYIRERVENPNTLRKQGYSRFRTKTVGDHKIIVAAKGPKDGGETKLQAILHPMDEIPHGTKSMEKMK
jgi:hypothetical protein